MGDRIEILKQKQNYFLWINDYLWMWDIPYEVEIQDTLAKQANGTVLVAGYGLGIIQRFLLQNRNVTNVTTVELYQGIISECEKVFGNVYGDIIIEDYFSYSPNIKYDCIIGDIWPDISPSCLDDYIKFKDKSMGLLKPDGKLLAWGQEYFEFLIHSNIGYTEKNLP